MGWNKKCYTRLTTGSRFIDPAVESAYNVEKVRLEQLRDDSQHDAQIQPLRDAVQVAQATRKRVKKDDR